MRFGKIGEMSLGLLTAGLVVGVFGCGPEADVGRANETSPAQDDSRTAIAVPEAGREMVRREMRQMLSALHGVLAATLNEDLAGAAEAARAGGMAVAVDTDPAVASRLPEEFERLGVATHTAFDDLARAVEAGATGDTVVARLGRLTSNCVSCHETYRLVASPASE